MRTPDIVGHGRINDSSSSSSYDMPSKAALFGQHVVAKGGTIPISSQEASERYARHVISDTYDLSLI